MAVEIGAYPAKEFIKSKLLFRGEAIQNPNTKTAITRTDSIYNEVDYNFSNPLEFLIEKPVEELAPVNLRWRAIDILREYKKPLTLGFLQGGFLLIAPQSLSIQQLESIPFINNLSRWDLLGIGIYTGLAGFTSGMMENELLKGILPKKNRHTTE